MKVCSKCSTKNEDAAGFCKSCGESLAEVPVSTEEFSAVAGDFLNKAGGLLSAGAKKAKDAAAAGAQKAQKAATEGVAKAQERHQESTAQKAESAKKSTMFVDPEERAMATIGANYMQNILGGGNVAHGYAVLTGKRVYYGGKSFSGLGKNAKSSTEECVIPVEDISLTRFIHDRAPGALIFGLALMILGAVLLVMMGGPLKILGGACAVAGVVFVVRAFTSRTTLFEIGFPGGRFMFNVKWYPIADMRDFQRQLHLVKDHVKEG